MKKIALIGAGFIGTVHAGNIGAHSCASLDAVSDVDPQRARALADRYGSRVATVEEILRSSADAVVIASSTNTHADLVERAAAAGKAVYCEKPIDLALDRALRARAAVDASGIPFMIGFNRRFDESNAACRAAIAAGDVGKIEIVQMSGRAASPPQIDYIRVSGGLIRDAVIHRFDLLRWLTDDEPVEVFAMGASLVDPAIGAAGDIDTAILAIRMASGAFCQIDSSRRTGYGHDERMEIFGSAGMVEAERQAYRHTRLYKGRSIIQDGLHSSWFERIAPTYRAAIDAFVRHIDGEEVRIPTIQDGIRAQVVAEAAVASLKSGTPTRCD